MHDSGNKWRHRGCLMACTAPALIVCTRQHQLKLQLVSTVLSSSSAMAGAEAESVASLFIEGFREKYYLVISCHCQMLVKKMTTEKRKGKGCGRAIARLVCK